MGVPGGVVGGVPGGVVGGVPGGVVGGVPGAVVGGVPGGVVGGVPGGVVGGVPGGQPTPSAGAVIPFGQEMEPPVLIAGRQPQYTAEAVNAGIEGSVLARCVITTEGRLVDCRIVKSIPLLDQEVLAALATRRYRPVLYQGHPQAVFYTLPFRFRLPAPVPPPAAPGSSP